MFFEDADTGRRFFLQTAPMRQNAVISTQLHPCAKVHNHPVTLQQLREFYLEIAHTIGVMEQRAARLAQEQDIAS